MSKTNAIRVGVRDLYVAKANTTVTESGTSVSYGTPAVFGGTATVSVTMETGDNKVYESDVKIHSNNRISGATISYESRSVDLAGEMEVLHGITSEGSDGYEDGPDDVGGEYAVGWADKLDGGGYKCQWYYYCTGHKGDESHETATESTTTPTDKFTFDATPSPATGKLRRRKVCATEAEKDAFFAAVLPAASSAGTETNEGGEGENP